LLILDLAYVIHLHHRGRAKSNEFKKEKRKRKKIRKKEAFHVPEMLLYQNGTAHYIKMKRVLLCQGYMNIYLDLIIKRKEHKRK
jgi:hypothetical protein